MEESVLNGTLADIRKQFFALRNGMIADTLRKGGLEQKYIFGLQLPQIKEIWQQFYCEDNEEAAEIARNLWKDKDCREARLLACHIMPPSIMTEKEATEWAKDVKTREEADILAFRLLRFIDNKDSIATNLKKSGSDLMKYTATAIERF